MGKHSHACMNMVHSTSSCLGFLRFTANSRNCCPSYSILPVKAPAPMLQAPKDSPLRAPTPTPTQASRLLDMLNSVHTDLLALPLTQGSSAPQLEAFSPLSSPRLTSQSSTRARSLAPVAQHPAPIQTPTGPNPIPVHAPPTRTLLSKAPVPRPLVPSPP